LAKPNLSDIDQPTRFIEETYLAGITASRRPPAQCGGFA
jgi:hypothetical protein